MKSILSYITAIKQYPLSYRLVGYVVIISSFFAILATATQLYLDYRRDVSALHRSLGFIERSYLKSIAVSAFKIDTDHLALELEGALKLPDIVYLEIRELRGNQVYTYAKGNPDARHIVRREYPLVYVNPAGEKRHLGTLVVNASLEEIYQRLWARLLTIFATNLVKTFLVSACILAVLYFMITRHLIKMARFTEDLIPGVQSHPLKLNRKSRETDKPDELEHVAIAINGLQERVTADILKQRQAELRYRMVADFTYDWEYWAGFNGELKYVSPSCERISGYSPQEFMDRPSLFREIIVPEDRGLWDQHYQDSRKELLNRELQFRIQRRDGKARWIEHACRPVYDDQGNALGFRASNRDITIRKQAEIDLKQSYSAIEQLKNQLEAESDYLREEIKIDHSYDKIIGRSDALTYVLYKVEQVAPTDSTVLILGETGTGKELIARAIHNASQYKDHPLVKVNCAALPANLIESELFGYEKGAFSGADARHVGRFEVADGTTLFLDEIGELPLELQPKLLRVLQEGEFERLGSSQTIKVNARVIAATNRDLEGDVRKGMFREDLFYRMNVFPITVPPLRDRKEDIPLLVNFFLERFCRRLGKKIAIIPSGVMQTLADYEWRGNVRELENVIERAVINSSGPKLRLMDDLTRSGREDFSAAVCSLEDNERNHIVRILKKTNWRVDGPKGAALILDINSSTLRSRMRKLGIRKP